MSRLGIDWLSLKPMTLVITISAVFGMACVGYSINRNKFINKNPKLLIHYYEEETLDEFGNWITTNSIKLDGIPKDTNSKRYIYKKSSIN